MNTTPGWDFLCEQGEVTRSLSHPLKVPKRNKMYQKFHVRKLLIGGKSFYNILKIVILVKNLVSPW